MDLVITVTSQTDVNIMMLWNYIQISHCLFNFWLLA